MGYNALYDCCELWDKNSPEFRRGERQLEKWHEQCRIKSIKARIEERKKQNAIKKIRNEQERLLKKLEEQKSSGMEK